MEYVKVVTEGARENLASLRLAAAKEAGAVIKDDGNSATLKLSDSEKQKD
jgi:hypothetical protein